MVACCFFRDSQFYFLFLDCNTIDKQINKFPAINNVHNHLTLDTTRLSRGKGLRIVGEKGKGATMKIFTVINSPRPSARSNKDSKINPFRFSRETTVLRPLGKLFARVLSSRKSHRRSGLGFVPSFEREPEDFLLLDDSSRRSETKGKNRKQFILKNNCKQTNTRGPLSV